MGPGSKNRHCNLIANKTDLEVKLIRRDKEGHFILIKGTVIQEDITVLNIYAPNSGVPNSIKKKYCWI